MRISFEKILGWLLVIALLLAIVWSLNAMTEPKYETHFNKGEYVFFISTEEMEFETEQWYRVVVRDDRIELYGWDEIITFPKDRIIYWGIDY